jgi:molybdopterin converting factor small subunit
MNIINTKTAILSTLREKANLKQLVYQNTKEVFEELRQIIFELEKEYNKELKEQNNNILLSYEDKGEFEFQLSVASDVLVFSLYTNVFQFNRDHNVWEQEYVKKDPSNAYSGIINIYNFLSDSFKYNRLDDLGYLVARIFINQERHFIVEGKRQMSLLQTDLSASKANKESLRVIVETAMNYSLNFDLLVPPYDNVKIVSVAQVFEKIQNARIQTGKRLGFQFKSDDV